MNKFVTVWCRPGVKEQLVPGDGEQYGESREEAIEAGKEFQLFLDGLVLPVAILEVDPSKAPRFRETIFINTEEMLVL